MRPTYQLPILPPSANFETVAILKDLARASRALAELKGRAAIIPNQGILIDTLSIQEAMASSEIENIITTQDEQFQASLFPNHAVAGPAKEVHRYRGALLLGVEDLVATGGVIRNNALIAMYQHLKERRDGFRVTPGTTLRSESSGQTVYVPPQDANLIRQAMYALEIFMNDDSASGLDPLIKMAIIHHQFQSIHPFADGNGRIGRILNVIYLTKAGLLDIPILYISRFINQNKQQYYALLQAVRDAQDKTEAWQAWVCWMLEAVAETSATTLVLVEGIRQQMQDTKDKLRSDLPHLYSQDLLNNLFRHPYTRIEFVKNDLSVSRPTASKYLKELAAAGLVEERKAGRNLYYVNTRLVALLLEVSGKER